MVFVPFLFFFGFVSLFVFCSFFRPPSYPPPLLGKLSLVQRAYQKFVSSFLKKLSRYNRKVWVRLSSHDVVKTPGSAIKTLCNSRLLTSYMRLKKNRPYNHWLKSQGHYLLCFSTSNGRSQFGSLAT